MAVNPAAFRRGAKKDPIAQRESNALRGQFFRYGNQRVYSPLGEVAYLPSAVVGEWSASNMYFMYMPPVREEMVIKYARAYVAVASASESIECGLFRYVKEDRQFALLPHSKFSIPLGATGLQEVTLPTECVIQPNQKVWLGFNQVLGPGGAIEAFDNRTTQKLVLTGSFTSMVNFSDLTKDTSGTAHPFVLFLSKTEKDFM